MNNVDEMIASITDKSKIMFQESIFFLNEDKYIEVLKGVFELYDSCTDTFRGTRFCSKQTTLAFGELLSPFLYYAKNIVSDNCDLRYISKNAMDDLDRLLLEKLSKLSSQTFFFEFSRIYDTIPKVSGPNAFLEDTEEAEDQIAERNNYDAFVTAFFDNQWINFYSEYSVLAMLMAALTLQWINMLTKFTDAFHKDYDEIKKMFFKSDQEGTITSIYAADHNGLSLEDMPLCLTFDHEEKLIYKARDIAAEQSFHRLLDWINTKCGSLPLKSIRMIAGDNYGWAEYVPQTACMSELEVKRFYTRAGMLLGLLHAFGSRDMHCNNLIANGENPVIIDLEALTGRHCDTDVRNTYFIPSDVILVDGRPVYGNALCAETVTGSIRKELQWKAVNSDRMKPVRRYRQGAPKSIVYLGDKIVYSFHYYDQLLQGFDYIYQYIMEHRKAIMEFIQEHFSSSFVRIFPRLNISYIDAINNSLPPGHMKSGNDRLTVLLKELERSGMRYQHMPDEILIYELKQLVINSIPRFNISYTDGMMKEVRDVNMADFHLGVPMDIVKNRINRFSSNDLEQQKTLIVKAFEDYKANMNKYEMEQQYV